MAAELASQQARPSLPVNLGPTWIRGFLGRHPEFRTKFAGLQDYQRLHATHPTPIRNYFNKLGAVLRKYNFQSHNMYNMDENGFQLAVHNRAKVIVRHRRRPPIEKMDGSRKWITVVECTSAEPGVTRPSPTDSAVSGSFMKAMFRSRAVCSWREGIIKGGRGRRPYRVPREGTVPRIPTALGRARRSLASRFFQLASGHAMIAPFLRDKFKWVDSDQCWWCSSGRQSREHLFKECRAWKSEIKELWKKVGEISSADGDNKDEISERERKGRKRRKGFGFFTQEYKARPGNCTVGRLMSDPRFTDAVLSFLEDTQVGSVRRGVIIRGEEAV